MTIKMKRQFLKCFLVLMIILVTYYYLFIFSNDQESSQLGQPQLGEDGLLHQDTDEFSQQNLKENTVKQEVAHLYDGISNNKPKSAKQFRKKKLPGVLIAGVKKCGSGALLEMLKLHPQLAGPGYHYSEVKFWNVEELYDKGMEYYKVSSLRLIY